MHQKILELEHFHLIGEHQVFFEDFDEEYLSLVETLSQDEIITNYIVDGYHSGIIINEFENSNGQIKIIKYRKAVSRETADITKQKGKYAGVYFITKEKDIIDNALKALSIIKNSDCYTIGPAYLKDVAADFVNVGNGYIPFLVLMRFETEN